MADNPYAAFQAPAAPSPYAAFQQQAPQPGAISQIGTSLKNQAKGLFDTLSGLVDPAQAMKMGKDATDASAQHWDQAKKAYQQGNYLSALGHGLASVPIIGPGVANVVAKAPDRPWEAATDLLAPLAVAGAINAPAALEASAPARAGIAAGIGDVTKGAAKIVASPAAAATTAAVAHAMGLPPEVVYAAATSAGLPVANALVKGGAAQIGRGFRAGMQASRDAAAAQRALTDAATRLTVPTPLPLEDFASSPENEPIPGFRDPKPHPLEAPPNPLAVQGGALRGAPGNEAPLSTFNSYAGGVPTAQRADAGAATLAWPTPVSTPAPTPEAPPVPKPHPLEAPPNPLAVQGGALRGAPGNEAPLSTFNSYAGGVPTAQRADAGAATLARPTPVSTPAPTPEAPPVTPTPPAAPPTDVRDAAAQALADKYKASSAAADEVKAQWMLDHGITSDQVKPGQAFKDLTAQIPNPNAKSGKFTERINDPDHPARVQQVKDLLDSKWATANATANAAKLDQAGVTFDQARTMTLADLQKALGAGKPPTSLDRANLMFQLQKLNAAKAATSAPPAAQ